MPELNRTILPARDPQVPAGFLAGILGAPERLAPRLARLTRRELEVVCLVAEGLSNDEIAAKLVVSPLTAKTHVSRAMTKVRARDRAQLVVYAYENGLAGWSRPAVPGTIAP
jgi:DNA-binding NarL/FixJ family response regulator